MDENPVLEVGNRLLRSSTRVRSILWRLVGTPIWVFFHLPYVRCARGCRVAFSVRVQPMWFDGRRLSLRLGHSVMLDAHVAIQGSGLVTIGDRSYIRRFSVIGCHERIAIGKDVMIADAVTIRDTDHLTSALDRPMNQQGVVSQPITIGDDVWIGHGASILRGVTIGSGAIVGSGAVVTKDVPPNTIVGGVPARTLARRTPDQEVPGP